jgi:hypothetical protein
MSTQPKAELEFSDDYRIISFKGQPLYRLTPRQAAIVRVLHRRPYCEASTHTIKKQAKCGPIHDSFKKGDGPEIWKNVIVHHPRGFHRLNLTTKNDERAWWLFCQPLTFGSTVILHCFSSHSGM